MKIGIDFDRVLFDTDNFDDYYKKETGLYNVETDVYDENGNYSPIKHADECGIPLESVWNAIDNLERFLYNDIDKLEEVSCHELIIVTRGFEEFQRKKIIASGILDFVDSFEVITSGSKDQADIDILVDDRKEEIERVSIPGIRLDRSENGLEKVVKKVKSLETERGV